MKKILLLIIIMFLGGCYDYSELTDLGIVDTLFIEYKDNKFIVDLEVYEANEKVDNPSFFITGIGEDFEGALSDCYRKSSKHLYFNHVNAVVMDKNTIENKLDDIYGFFIVDPDIRKEAYFLICTNIESLKLYKIPDKSTIGETIKRIIEYNSNENGKYKTSKFSLVLDRYLGGRSYMIGDIAIDNNSMALKDTYLFLNNTKILKLNSSSVLLDNILSNSIRSFDINIDDNYKIYKYNTNLKIEKDTINIIVKLDVKLLGCANQNYNDAYTVEKIKSKISNYFNDFIIHEINYAIKNDIDIFNFDDYIYKYKNKDYKKGIWKKMNYSVLVNTNISEKGLLLNGLEMKEC